MKHLSRAWHQASEREGPCTGSPKHSYKWKEEPHRQAVLSAGMSSNSTVNTRAARGHAGAPKSQRWPNCCLNPAQTQPKPSLSLALSQPEPSPNSTQPKLSLNPIHPQPIPNPAHTQPQPSPNPTQTHPQPNPNSAQIHPQPIPNPTQTQPQPEPRRQQAQGWCSEQSRLRTAERWEQDASCTLET